MSFHAREFAELSEADRAAEVAKLTPAEAYAMRYDWLLWARPEQRIPEGDWINWLNLGGRGTGKTRVGAETVRQWVKRYQYVNLIGATVDDVRTIMVEGESGILAICPRDERPHYVTQKRELHWPNGNKSLLFSAEEPDRLRGKQHAKLWLDELAAWRYPDAFDQASFGLRLGDKPQTVITTTPRPTAIIKDLLKESVGDNPKTHVTRGSTYDNIANLADSFIHTIVKKFEGTRLGRQELNAEVLDDMPNAMWTRAMLERAFVSADIETVRKTGVIRPGVTLRYIIVSIDPATTSGEDSNETGLIVVGRGSDGHGYVLEDASAVYSVAGAEWARKAVKLYRAWNANKIVAETNQGGDMIEATIRMHDAKVPFSGTHAKDGKAVRAEPVSMLYEQNMVHHIGVFAKLEDQMSTFTNDLDRKKAKYSPDRVDALVWGITELQIDPSGNTGFLDFMREESEIAAGKRMKPTESPSTAANPPVSTENQAARKSPEFVTLIVPPANRGGVICGFEHREYTPDVMGMIRVVAEDAPPLKRAGFIEIQVAA